MLTNWPARTDVAISGAWKPRTNIPRATWRRPVTGASTRNNGASPLVDGPDLHLLARVDRGLEQRARGVEGRQAWDAPLDCGTPDLEAVLDHGVAIAGVLVDVRHRVDHELHLASDDGVDHSRSLLADLGHHPRREAGRAQRAGSAVGGHQLAAELHQPRGDREELGLVRVGDGQQGGGAALQVHARREEG